MDFLFKISASLDLAFCELLYLLDKQTRQGKSYLSIHQPKLWFPFLLFLHLYVKYDDQLQRKIFSVRMDSTKTKKRFYFFSSKVTFNPSKINNLRYFESFLKMGLDQFWIDVCINLKNIAKRNSSHKTFSSKTIKQSMYRHFKTLKLQLIVQGN